MYDKAVETIGNTHTTVLKPAERHLLCSLFHTRLVDGNSISALTGNTVSGNAFLITQTLNCQLASALDHDVRGKCMLLWSYHKYCVVKTIREVLTAKYKLIRFIVFIGIKSS